jgi:hypothetical protein
MNFSVIFKSKTLLFGLLLAVASIVQIFIPYLPAEYTGIVGSVISAAVIGLRFLTTLPLDQK